LVLNGGIISSLKKIAAGHPWLMPVILSNQETEIWRIAV
jgi:hypothetical protein